MFVIVGLPGFELGLNPPKGLVLPLHYSPKKYVPREGIEPPTPSSSGMRYYH